MTAIFMAFAGQFAFFTYIRPVFMTMAGFDVDGLTLVLLSFGIASFVGTSLSSQFLKRSRKWRLLAPRWYWLSVPSCSFCGQRQMGCLGDCDYLGLCLCAGAGGLVDVDHPLACRSG